MPAYDFHCSDCADVFEVTRPMSAHGDEPCPRCGARATRVFNSVGIAFKGTGFHNTDYRPRPKEESAAPVATPAAAPACAAKSESSPACASCAASSE